ncbi:COesterase and/or Abhydrolase 3 domain containing protein [Asbolus verrucosus]|uniref:COesterase and/or Abhydrolase 3 domain containing protein n=1 Tax=Asbolus verrucosus TaxID=1661398 RepID=A0A482VD44_ASBVE|nr:COesterase and/or Abhydrolase 3 domain containing protein [Asbolus verrucosus]
MDKPIIAIQQGKLRGRIAEDIDGKIYYSFQGIPYAKPPLGKLRFKPSLPPLPWDGILDATKNGNCCYSKDLFTKEFTGSEDCLNLNVYTPKLPDEQHELRPVMVWIHGGGFTCGSNSSEFYGPEFLITSNVVIVTINYRLGLLGKANMDFEPCTLLQYQSGFLSLEDPSLRVQGNAGFKDMVMALKWVQSNIKKFNGDPNNVTIFGESAGGYTKQEGMVIDTYRETRIINMINDFESNVPYFLGYETGGEESKALGQKIKKFYYGTEEPNQNNKHRFYEVLLMVMMLLTFSKVFSPRLFCRTQSNILLSNDLLNCGQILPVMAIQLQKKMIFYYFGKESIIIINKYVF